VIHICIYQFILTVCAVLPDIEEYGDGAKLQEAVPRGHLRDDVSTDNIATDAASASEEGIARGHSRNAVSTDDVDVDAAFAAEGSVSRSHSHDDVSIHAAAAADRSELLGGHSRVGMSAADKQSQAIRKCEAAASVTRTLRKRFRICDSDDDDDVQVENRQPSKIDS
jgi:hypothetical protein